jgi:hypothetical protein
MIVQGEGMSKTRIVSKTLRTIYSFSIQLTGFKKDRL